MHAVTCRLSDCQVWVCAFNSRPFCSRLCADCSNMHAPCGASVTEQYYLILVSGRWFSAAAGLVESNTSLLYQVFFTKGRLPECLSNDMLNLSPLADRRLSICSTLFTQITREFACFNIFYRRRDTLK